jgi:hypothetical protein
LISKGHNLMTKNKKRGPLSINAAFNSLIVNLLRNKNKKIQVLRNFFSLTLVYGVGSKNDSSYQSHNLALTKFIFSPFFFTF